MDKESHWGQAICGSAVLAWNSLRETLRAHCLKLWKWSLDCIGDPKSFGPMNQRHGHGNSWGLTAQTTNKRCQSHGISTKKSCTQGVEPAQESAMCCTQQSLKASKAFDIGLGAKENLAFSCCFNLAFSQYFLNKSPLISLGMALCMLCHWLLEVCNWLFDFYRG